MMSYKELYIQYEKCIAIQNAIITKCRQDYIDTLHGGDKNKAEKLAKILKTYYDERNDLLVSANEIKKYIE